ncbi:MAG: hypothetical protein K1X61_14830 [Chitinophagales bacterium]|nr:hypothetical protein [Chitinophagales bacterium]
MMAPKASLLLTTLACLLSLHNSANAGVTINEALNNKWIKVTIRGYDYRTDSVYRSSFYGNCLIMTCKNLRTVPVEITESPGRFLQPDDTTLQRMVLTKALALHLGAQQEITTPLYAMCTEAHDGAPGYATQFRAGKMASAELIPLINFIASNHYQNDAAQQAVWCMTDQYSPYTITSDDTVISNRLRKFVCGLKHVKYEKDSGEQKGAPLFRMVDGTFTYTIQKPKTVDLIIYNEAGQEIKKLVTHASQAAGTYDYNYHFNLPINDNALLQQALIIKFFLNGTLIAEKKHVLRS